MMMPEHNEEGLVMKDTIYESAAETAKKVRTELKNHFPGVKFSVTSKEYSGGSSVSVHWTDGPRGEEVDQVLNRFESSSFDGMIDLETTHGYEYQGKHYCGAHYVQGQRSLSNEYRAKLEAFAANYFADFDPNDYTYWRKLNEAEEIMCEKEAATQPQPPTEIHSCEGVTIRENKEKNGVEVIFATRPATEILFQLKAAGFRWHHGLGFWYAKRNEETLALAQSLTN
jgi:hypothetical protein